MADEKSPVHWTHTIQSGDWNVIKYGIVEYLRKHPRMRSATAILGVVWMFGWLLSFGGFKWTSSLLPTIGGWFVSPVLLWMAVVSGANHSLTFAPPKAPDPPTAPALPEAKSKLLNPEEFGIEGLNSICNATREQAKGAYRGFLFCLITGICVSTAYLLLLGANASFISYRHVSLYVWAAAGLFLFLSVVQLLRSILLEKRTSRLEDKMVELQSTITALKFIERNPGSITASIDSTTVITKLLAPKASTSS